MSSRRLSVCVSVGLDNVRPLIHEHCKKLLVNMLLLYASHADHFTVAKVAINSRTVNELSCLNVALANTATRSHTTGTSHCLSLCFSLSQYLSVCLSACVCLCASKLLLSIDNTNGGYERLSQLFHVLLCTSIARSDVSCSHRCGLIELSRVLCGFLSVFSFLVVNKEQLTDRKIHVRCVTCCDECDVSLAVFES